MKKRKGQVPKYYENDKFEEFLGIESTEIVYNNRYNDDYYRYEPTSYSGLICAFDELTKDITRFDRLVDFGCGKGRVLFYVNQRFSCEVCGVEVDEELYEQALDNRAFYNTRFRDQQEKIEIIKGKAEEYEIRPEQINLEITETAEISALTILQENVEKLHAKGISFSLDDYGSGYSTLGYIHQFPFRIIKLDKLMVWDAFETERAGITLKHTVGMIKDLNMHIVAEGVETEQQQKRLSVLGCDYLQGWYYSKAVPPDKFAQMIKKAS